MIPGSVAWYDVFAQGAQWKQATLASYSTNPLTKELLITCTEPTLLQLPPGIFSGHFRVRALAPVIIRALEGPQTVTLSCGASLGADAALLTLSGDGGILVDGLKLCVATSSSDRDDSDKQIATSCVIVQGPTMFTDCAFDGSPQSTCAVVSASAFFTQCDFAQGANGILVNSPSLAPPTTDAAANSHMAAPNPIGRKSPAAIEVTVEDCGLKNLQLCGIRATPSSSDAVTLKVDHVTLEDVGGTGIIVGGICQATIKDSVISRCGASGVVTEGSSATWLVQCNVEDCRSVAVLAAGESRPVMQNCSIRGNGATPLVVLQGKSSATFHRNEVERTLDEAVEGAEAAEVNGGGDVTVLAIQNSVDAIVEHNVFSVKDRRQQNNRTPDQVEVRGCGLFIDGPCAPVIRFNTIRGPGVDGQQVPSASFYGVVFGLWHDSKCKENVFEGVASDRSYGSVDETGFSFAIPRWNGLLASSAVDEAASQEPVPQHSSPSRADPLHHAAQDASATQSATGSRLAELTTTKKTVVVHPPRAPPSSSRSEQTATTTTTTSTSTTSTSYASTIQHHASSSSSAEHHRSKSRVEELEEEVERLRRQLQEKDASDPSSSRKQRPGTAPRSRGAVTSTSTPVAPPVRPSSARVTRISQNTVASGGATTPRGAESTGEPLTGHYHRWNHGLFGAFLRLQLPLRDVRAPIAPSPAPLRDVDVAHRLHDEYFEKKREEQEKAARAEERRRGTSPKLHRQEQDEVNYRLYTESIEHMQEVRQKLINEDRARFASPRVEYDAERFFDRLKDQNKKRGERREKLMTNYLAPLASARRQPAEAIEAYCNSLYKSHQDEAAVKAAAAAVDAEIRVKLPKPYVVPTRRPKVTSTRAQELYCASLVHSHRDSDLATAASQAVQDTRILKLCKAPRPPPPQQQQQAARRKSSSPGRR